MNEHAIIPPALTIHRWMAVFALAGLGLPCVAGLVFIANLVTSHDRSARKLPEFPITESASPAIEAKPWSGPLGYRLSDVRKGHIEVPRTYLSDLPRELPALSGKHERKTLFFTAMLPLVLQVNELLKADRQRIIDLKTRVENGEVLLAKDTEWLEGMASEYRVPGLDFDILLERVNVVPPSLALGQAALESGWGTSRFAQLGNAPFGERAWTSENGMIPRNRQDGDTHEIRAFGHLMDAVYGYILNLNRHSAYDQFREARAQLITKGRRLTGIALAPALTNYSERGVDYVTDLLTIMQGNRLEDFDSARLQQARLQQTGLQAVPSPRTQMALR